GAGERVVPLREEVRMLRARLTAELPHVLEVVLADADDLARAGERSEERLRMLELDGLSPLDASRVATGRLQQLGEVGETSPVDRGHRCTAVAEHHRGRGSPHER